MHVILSTPHGRAAGAPIRSKPLFSVLFGLMLLMVPFQVHAESSPVSDQIEAALGKLIAVGDSQGAQQIDPASVDALVSFVQKTPELGLHALQNRQDIQGASIVYELKRPLTDIIRYAYNQRIPEGAVNPSSVNYACWKEVAGSGNTLPDLWKTLEATSSPQITRGMVREFISPDLHTGAYYEYDLRRTLVVQRRGTNRIVLSISTLPGPSEVGRKGFIVGNDQDWNYLYTQEVGLNKAGLGWVKARIYDFFSICCYVEDDARPGTVRVAAFQWLGAGWAGLNVVDAHHIERGLQRYADQFKALMESRRMPGPAELEHLYAALEGSDEALLRQKAVDVTQFVLQKARRDQDLGKKKLIQSLDANAYVALMDKHQLVSSLMREYVKYCLGKQTALSPTFWVALQQGGPKRSAPLS